MFGLSFTELLLVGIVMLLVFGPERMPEIARTLGRSFAKLRRSMDELKYEFNLHSLDNPPQPGSIAKPHEAVPADDTPKLRGVSTEQSTKERDKGLS